MRKKELRERVSSLETRLEMERDLQRNRLSEANEYAYELQERLKDLHLVPEVMIQGGAWLGTKFVCTGKYASFDFNPFASPSWPDFQVNFNGEWIVVRITDHDESTGWRAQDLASIEAETQVTPRIDIRPGR